MEGSEVNGAEVMKGSEESSIFRFDSGFMFGIFFVDLCLEFLFYEDVLIEDIVR